MACFIGFLRIFHARKPLDGCFRAFLKNAYFCSVSRADKFYGLRGGYDDRLFLKHESDNLVSKVELRFRARLGEFQPV